MASVELWFRQSGLGSFAHVPPLFRPPLTFSSCQRQAGFCLVSWFPSCSASGTFWIGFWLGWEGGKEPMAFPEKLAS